MVHFTCKSDPRGVTILEIMLALLILGGCVAILGEISRNAFRNAKESVDLTQAELLAESILSRVRIGIIDMEAVQDSPVTDFSSSSLVNDDILDSNVVSDGQTNWLYSLEIVDIDDYGLVELAVTVRQNLSEENKPISCRLVRWFALEPKEESEASASSP